MHSHIKQPTFLMLVTLIFFNDCVAAGLDRSGQSITDFFQEGIYASISYNYSIPHIGGNDTGLSSQGKFNEIPNLSRKSSSFRSGLKFDLNEKISLGVIYDQPFSISLKHHGHNDFVSQTEYGVQGTQANLDSNNLTGLVGLNINKNFGIFAGPAIEEVAGQVKLRGQIYKNIANYDAELLSDYSTGWVAGFNIKKPEVGLKSSLTYRSEIEHDAKGAEQFTAISQNVYLSNVKFISPKSVNFDFQTGLSKTTQLTTNIRWVPWSDFEFKPPKLAERTAPATLDRSGYPLINYKKDQWSAQIGLGQKITDKISFSASILWDSGLGNPANALGPIDGYWGTGLGAQYKFLPNWAISISGRYLWFGDTQAARQNGDIVGNFTDNHSYSLGFKLTYQKR